MKLPLFYEQQKLKSEALGFNMPSDVLLGSLLKTLVTSKPKGNFLELGTGTGLSLSWMIAGIDDSSTIISLDNEEKFLQVAKANFDNDQRVTIICADGGEWISTYTGYSFDLIFADTWPGKYTHLEETLALVKPGGFYVVDDLNPQKNWPDGHDKKAEKLIDYLASRDDFNLARLDWSTGIIVMSRKSFAEKPQE
jgi:predicted O-methyltransferase YrrM